MLTTLRQRNFALLWIGGLISQTGDWLLQVGLPVYVYLLTGSALATGVTLIVSFAPNFLLGSVAGVFVDRWPRRRTMLIVSLLQAAGLLPLLFLHDRGTLWLLYPVLFGEALIEQFFQPAQNALLPELVKEEQLLTANALLTISGNVSRLAGAALGGILLAISGLRLAVLLDLLSFLLAAGAFWLIKEPAAGSSRTLAIEARRSSPAAALSTLHALLASWRHIGYEWLEGIQYTWRRPTLLMLFVVWMVTRLGEGFFGTLLIVFVRQVLGAGAALYGSLLSVQALGSLLGGLLIAQTGGRLQPARLLGAGLALFGLLDLLIIDLPLFMPSFWLVGGLFILVGLPDSASLVGFQTCFQQSVEDRLRGRVYGALLATGSLMTLSGMLIAGALGDATGPLPLLNIQGGSYLLSGLFILFVFHKMTLKKRISTPKNGL